MEIHIDITKDQLDEEGNKEPPFHKIIDITHKNYMVPVCIPYFDTQGQFM